MGSCLSRNNSMRHPREETMWKGRTDVDKVKQLSPGRSSTDEFSDSEDSVDVRKSLSEDSLSQKVTKNRVLL